MEPLGFEPLPQPVPVPSPVPVPLPVAAFVNGCRSGQQPRSLSLPPDFDGDIIGDDLDKLLDQAEPESAMVRWGGGALLMGLELLGGECARV